MLIEETSGNENVIVINTSCLSVIKPYAGTVRMEETLSWTFPDQNEYVLRQGGFITTYKV